MGGGLDPGYPLPGKIRQARFALPRGTDWKGLKLKAELEVTQKIKSYGGKEVEIQGFIIPAGLPDLSFFLLSRVSAMGNYCCEAPVGQDETVYVFAAKGVKILYDPLRVYKVRGVFEAGMQTDKTYGVSLFYLRHAQVEEAVGAKIFKVGEPTAPASNQ